MSSRHLPSIDRICRASLASSNLLPSDNRGFSTLAYSIGRVVSGMRSSPWFPSSVDLVSIDVSYYSRVFVYLSTLQVSV